MNTKAQFFILFGVIFGILLLSIFVKYNFAKSSTEAIQEFHRLCYNYRHEIFTISKNYTLGGAIDELEEIINFTNYFLEDNEGVEIFFVYGNTSNLRIQNNLTEKINFFINETSAREVAANRDLVFLNEEVRNVSIQRPFKRFLKITNDKNFHSILRIQKNGEVYYC
ncbi:MAG: hypothetical protein NZ889_02825 [Candidatus Pacearchaeota archaeon]|nr:hypothetical protein [Candidatus Pacearchaeota archaeon]